MSKTVGHLGGPLAVFLLAHVCAAPVLALEPANLRWGPLYLTPTMDLKQYHTDNLLRSEDDEISTWGTVVNPRAQLWAQNNLDTYSLTYELEDGRYADSSDDDYTNHTFRSEVNKEIYGPHSVTLFAKYLNVYEPRGTGLTEGSLAEISGEPLKYDQTGFGAQYTLGNNQTRGRFEAELRTEEYHYKNLREFTRNYDRDEDSLRTTVFYRVGGRTDVLGEIRRKDTDYRLDDTDDDRLSESLDSDETVYLVGASWEATRNTTGSVKVGAFDRDLESDSRSNDSGFHWEADVLWEPRTFSTFQLGTRRVSSETNGVGDFSDSREYMASWDYEWSGRLATRVDVMYADDTYPGSPRSDDRYEFGARVDYNFRLWMDFGAGYRYEERSSSLDDLDYSSNEFFLDVKLSL